MPDYVDHNAAEQAILDRSVLRAGGTAITSSAAGVIGLIVKGAASQTANLQEWQNSAGTVLAKIGADGTTTIIGGSNSGESLHTRAGSAATRGLVVRGAASQTANLQEWQDSAGGLLGEFHPVGLLSIGSSRPTNSGGNGSMFAALINASSRSGLVIKGASGQTANLAEFQNSSGTVLAGVDSSGHLIGPGLFGTAPNAGYRPLTIRGAASQTANLAEFQNSSGTVLSGISASGSISAPAFTGELHNQSGGSAAHKFVNQLLNGVAAGSLVTWWVIGINGGTYKVPLYTNTA